MLSSFAPYSSDSVVILDGILDFLSKKHGNIEDAVMPLLQINVITD